MGLGCALCSSWLRTVAVVGLLGFLLECHTRETYAQTTEKQEVTEAEGCVVRDVRSRHFFIHTDLSPDEADEYVERLETMLGQISKYWDRPSRDVIECFIVQNLDEFPVSTIAPAGVRGVRTFGGVTVMDVSKEGRRPLGKSVVYASARPEVVQHEVVHAYCHQAFCHIGPVWYSEGMAEMGRFWTKGDMAVRADPREIEFLRDNPPKSLAKILSPAQTTGDCWQNYASRWALCHFLARNPNYAHRFRQLGRGLLEGKDVSFDQTFAGMIRPLFFEYLFFLRHIGRGFRVDLCAWDWKRSFTRLQPGRTLRVGVAAGRGWQPSGLTVRPGTQYEYVAEGTWQIAGQPEPVDTDGDCRGRGRLMGVLMNDHQLGTEFELGARGSFQLATDGDLYLRCHNAWNELDGDRGHVSVKFQLHEQDASPYEADSTSRTDRRTR